MFVCCGGLYVAIVVSVVDLGRLLFLGGVCFCGFLFIGCCVHRCRCHSRLMLLLDSCYSVLLLVVCISVLVFETFTC